MLAELKSKLRKLFSRPGKTDEDFSPDSLREARWPYYQVLRAQFQAIAEVPSEGSSAHKVLKEISDATNKDNLDKGQVYVFETLLPYVLPKEVLARSIQSIQERLRVSVGKEEYDRYL